MTIIVTDTLPEENWRSFVEEHPAGNIFHTPEMFQVFEQSEGHQPTLWAAVDEDQSPLALLLPVQITLMNGLMHRFTTRAVVYGSLLCTPDLKGRQASDMLLQAYQQEMGGKILFTELRNLSEISGDIQQLLQKNKFIFEGHLNFLIDLEQSEETLWKNISKSGRQSIRTSRNKGIIVEEVIEREKMKVAYQMLQKVYTLAQIPLASATLFEAAFDILAPKGMLKVFLAQIDKDYIGTCLLLAYKGRIIDWYAGSDRAFSSFYPSESLIWHTLKWGQKNHYHLFDFGGAGKPDEDYGPRKFKAKFGGELVDYGRNTFIHAPMKLKFSQRGYQILRRFL